MTKQTPPQKQAEKIDNAPSKKHKKKSGKKRGNKKPHPKSDSPPPDTGGIVQKD